MFIQSLCSRLPKSKPKSLDKMQSRTRANAVMSNITRRSNQSKLRALRMMNRQNRQSLQLARDF